MVMRVIRGYLSVVFFRNVWDNVLRMAQKRSVLAPAQFNISVFVMTWMMQKGVSFLSWQMNVKLGWAVIRHINNLFLKKLMWFIEEKCRTMAWICAEGFQKKIWSCGVSQAERESAMPLLQEHFPEKSELLVGRSSHQVTLAVLPAGHLVSSWCHPAVPETHGNPLCLLWGTGLQGTEWTWLEAGYPEEGCQELWE